MTGLQLFAPSWLGLDFVETPITADKREIPVCRQAGRIPPNPDKSGLLLSAKTLGEIPIMITGRAEWITLWDIQRLV